MEPQHLVQVLFKDSIARTHTNHMEHNAARYCMAVTNSEMKVLLQPVKWQHNFTAPSCLEFENLKPTKAPVS
jgi:hypothetical protein